MGRTVEQLLLSKKLSCFGTLYFSRPVYCYDLNPAIECHVDNYHLTVDFSRFLFLVFSDSFLDYWVLCTDADAFKFSK